MDWTLETRLKIIRELAAMAYIKGRPSGESHKLLMQRIMFLCDMSDEFLERNKGQYEDAIRSAKMGGLIVSL